jgi:hypothetical protein
LGTPPLRGGLRWTSWARSPSALRAATEWRGTQERRPALPRARGLSFSLRDCVTHRLRDFNITPPASSSSGSKRHDGAGASPHTLGRVSPHHEHRRCAQPVAQGASPGLSRRVRPEPRRGGTLPLDGTTTAPPGAQNIEEEKRLVAPRTQGSRPWLPAARGSAAQDLVPELAHSPAPSAAWRLERGVARGRQPLLHQTYCGRIT